MKFLMFSLLTISILLTTSCKKDEVVTRNDYVGEWDAAESITIGGQTTTQEYSFSIAPDPGVSDRIQLVGFANTSGANISAVVNGSNFTTDEVSLMIIGGESGTLNGSGSLSGNTLTYSYSIVTPTITQTFNGTATKK